MDQQRQLESFKGFRHDKGKLDKLRTVISNNADIIQGVAKHVADAASTSFPPSSALLTAFTFVMNASKHVSEDYDMVSPLGHWESVFVGCTFPCLIQRNKSCNKTGALSILAMEFSSSFKF